VPQPGIGFNVYFDFQQLLAGAFGPLKPFFDGRFHDGVRLAP
jgi:hypothetical protein